MTERFATGDHVAWNSEAGHVSGRISKIGGSITEEAIGRLVSLFYARARRDEMLGPVFGRAIGEGDLAWAAQIARISDFWSSVMLTSGRYHGDPFSAHLRLAALQPAMSDRWLALFRETCADLFEPAVAGAFRVRAARIAQSLRMGVFERMPARLPTSDRG